MLIHKERYKEILPQNYGSGAIAIPVSFMGESFNNRYRYKKDKKIMTSVEMDATQG